MGKETEAGQLMRKPCMMPQDSIIERFLTPVATEMASIK
jgi:hypothetical protein